MVSSRSVRRRLALAALLLTGVSGVGCGEGDSNDEPRRPGPVRLGVVAAPAGEQYVLERTGGRGCLRLRALTSPARSESCFGPATATWVGRTRLACHRHEAWIFGVRRADADVRAVPADALREVSAARAAGATEFAAILDVRRARRIVLIGRSPRAVLARRDFGRDLDRCPRELPAGALHTVTGAL
jgi:hypothetical protein